MERLSESKALEIIKLETKRQATLNKRIDLKIWELKSGEIISSVRDNYYILYENNSEFKKIWPKEFFKLHVTDALYKKNPYGKSLPRYFRSLILDLFKALEYKKQKIFYNDKFLNKLDYMYSVIPNKKIF